MSNKLIYTKLILTTFFWGEILIVASNHNSEGAIGAYCERWTIEILFSCLKPKGFDFEATHMTNQNKIDRLLGVLTLDFVWAY